MSLAGGGCPLPYPSRGNANGVNAMAVPNISSAVNSPCSQFRAVRASPACSQQLLGKESKGSLEAKENGSLSHVLKAYSGGSQVSAAAGSTFQHPAVVLYPREKVCVNWHQAVPKYREPVGLWNAGNSCFLNSVLQCLTFTPPLANYFLFEGHKSKLRFVLPASIK